MIRGEGAPPKFREASANKGGSPITLTEEHRDMAAAIEGRWEIRSHLRSFALRYAPLDLEIELPTSGWGAFLVRIGPKVCSVFCSGALNERSLRVWRSRGESDGQLVWGNQEQGHCQTRRTASGWRCHNRLSGVSITLEDSSGFFFLSDELGVTKVDLGAIAALLGIDVASLLRERGPWSEISHDSQAAGNASSVLGRPAQQGDEESRSSDLHSPQSATPLALESPTPAEFIEPLPDPVGQNPTPSLEPAEGAIPPFPSVPGELSESDQVATFYQEDHPGETLLDVESQAHGLLTLRVPLTLNDKELIILEYLARYGQATRQELRLKAGRRSEGLAATLIDRLNHAGYPCMRVTEGNSYEFTPIH